MTTGPNDPQGQDNQGTGDPQIIHSLIVHSNGVEYELDPKGKEFPTDAYEYPKGTIVRIIVKNVPDGKELVEGHALEVVMDEDKSFTLELQDELPVLPPLPAKAKVTMTVVPNGGSYTLTPEGDKVGDDQYEFDEGTEVVVECTVPPVGQKLIGYRVTWEGNEPQEVASTGKLTVPAMPCSAIVELVFENEAPATPPTPPQDDKSSLSDRPMLDELDGEDDDLGGGTPAPAKSDASRTEDKPKRERRPKPESDDDEDQPKRELKSGIGSGKLNPWVVGIGSGCGCLSVLALLFTMVFVGGVAYYKLSRPTPPSQQQSVPVAQPAGTPDQPAVDPATEAQQLLRSRQPGSLQGFNPYVRRTPAEEEIEALRRENAEIKEDLGEILETLRQQAPQQPN